MVEVIAPDGKTELWAADVAFGEAVATVRKAIPPDYIIKPATQRLPVTWKLAGFPDGGVRRVRM